MTWETLVARIGETGNAKASVKGETPDGKNVTVVKSSADTVAVAAFLDAEGEDLRAFTDTFEGNAVKVTAKHGARAVTDTILL